MIDLYKYKWIMFDLDNTLVDFKNASKIAFEQAFKDHDLKFSADIYKVYNEINANCWKLFEEGKKTAMDIRKERFTLTFEQLGIEGVDGFEFNALYLKYLIQNTKAYDGVIDMLKQLKNTHLISIVTNGLKEVQRPRLKLTKMNDLFDSIIVSDEIGYSKPNQKYFEIAYNSINYPPDKSKILVVGDSLRSDIKGANNFGLDSCWISDGKENDSDVIPSYTIESVTSITSS